VWSLFRAGVGGTWTRSEGFARSGAGERPCRVDGGRGCVDVGDGVSREKGEKREGGSGECVMRESGDGVKGSEV
jgi:hypothetical protein